MKIQLRFFASVREKLACSSELIECDSEIKTAADLRRHLQARGGVWAQALAQDSALRMAYDQKMAHDDQLLSEGGELAFFPPVTGG